MNIYTRLKKNKKKKKEKQEKQEEKQDKKTINTDEYIEWMINKEDASVNDEVFQKYF